MEMRWISLLGMVLRKEGTNRFVGFWRLPQGNHNFEKPHSVWKGAALVNLLRALEGLCAQHCAGSGSRTEKTKGRALSLRGLQLAQGDKISTPKAEEKENFIKAYTVRY